MKKPLLEVKVFCSPIIKKIPYKGEAKAVSSENKLGRFDILPGHANFITLIFNNIIIHTPDKNKITYQFKRGVLETSEDKVRIFLGL